MPATRPQALKARLSKPQGNALGERRKKNSNPVGIEEILRVIDQAIQTLIESESIGGIIPKGLVTREIRVLTCARKVVSESRWIPVRNEMPDADLSVLIHNNDRHFSEPVWIGYYDGECWRSAAGEPVRRVTHWKHLPEPPSC
jgi:hypothetical protein